MAIVVVAVIGLVVSGFPASASAQGFVAGPRVVCVPGQGACDADGDQIPDAVESAVCGSVTCATGREDTDADGLADWVEFQASGSLTKVDPSADRDGDGIPDFAERLVCGSDRCSTGREDVDGDGVADWAEVVICGDVTCAEGSEDLDGDGVADADALAACVIYGRGENWLATTGVAVGAWLLAAAVLIGVGAFVRAWVSRRRSINGSSGTEDLAQLLDAR
ncbi:hypothetical protein [Cellulosimicrobium cellulans]|uniref:hypothetical protein n=1 Tax=Cellulosimicrobium cellulans TaxID=1710 RepID=UPI0024052E37|nr:hypothetical protein [Cellulosimicrobium cellulans]